MAGPLCLRVFTPMRVALEQDADFVVLRCVEGDKGILPGHERFVARLQSGMMHIYQDKRLAGSLFVMGGTLWVEDDRVTVLTEMAGGAEEVKMALLKLEEQLELRRKDELRSDMEIHRAEAALRNALVHMDVSSYTVLHGSRNE